MGAEFKVVVEGGGLNLYRVVEYDSGFRVYQITGGMFRTDRNSVGKADSLKGALALIESHSGESVESIKEYES